VKASEREKQFLAIWRGHVTDCDPTPHFRFHPTRKWEFDFAWEPIKLAVEIEGGTFGGGRHGSGPGFHKDCEKYNEAILLGWRVLRFDSMHLKQSAAEVVDVIARAMGAVEDNSWGVTDEENDLPALDNYADGRAKV
jgi:hypothetical protein